MLYSCTHVATLGVKGLKTLIGVAVVFTAARNCPWITVSVSDNCTPPSSIASHRWQQQQPLPSPDSHRSTFTRLH